MPKIPGISYDQQAPGALDFTKARGTEFGSQSAEGMQQLGNTLGNITTALYETYQDSKGSKAVSDAQAQIQEFTHKLKFGSTDETGKPIPPPDPETHEELYKKEVDRISKEAENNLSGRGLNVFNSEFRSYSQKQGFAIKENAAELYRSRIQAYSDESLDQDAVSFVEANELTKPQIHAGAMNRIAALEKSGFYSPQEGLARRKRFVEESEVGSILKLVRTDPDAAASAIQAGEFKNLPAEKQQRYLDVALNASDRQVRQRNAEMDRQEAENRRQDAEVQKETAKQGFSLLYDKSGSKLTPQWVEDNRDSLTVEHYHVFARAATGRSESGTSPEVLSSLMLRAHQGKDVIPEATSAAARQLISVSELSSIINTASQEGIVASSENFFKRGKSYLTESLKPDAAATGFEKDMAAKAFDDWYDWSKAHPNASQAEAKKEYQAIANEAKATNLDNLQITQMVPRYLKGGRAEVSYERLQQAFQDTKKAFEAGEIDRYQYQRQSDILLQWGKIITKPETAAPTSGQ